MPLNLLALDASSSACSAALLRQGDSGTECLAHFEMTPRAHTRRLLPMVDALLAEAQVTPSNWMQWPLAVGRVHLQDYALPPVLPRDWRLVSAARY
ncbi:hypothetical protein HSBAA_52780 [Vreelandella sulfidaeris]|uniref:Uncharacterized protein n=1 Tax=Vreelandella sulfidaeris TaxID=115553 RepID=A0A455UCL9_9GAMM|nr:hypothetical protein HSBAA_52780 [Halomonas sulfidaeris]